MREIMLLIHGDEGQEARIAAAVDLARALDGYITAVDVLGVPGAFYRTCGGMPVALRLEEDKEEQRRNREAVAKRLHAEGVAFDWASDRGNAEEILPRVAALSDVAIVSSALVDADSPPPSRLIRSLVTRSGLLVLAVPPHCSGLNFGDTALILWDGSLDCKAALHQSMPLLRLAAQVTILHIDDGSLAAPLQEAHDYLARHRVNAHESHRNTWGGRTASALTRYLARKVPALVVMGAYGHRPLSERLFGSVTTELLATSQVPLLLAHHG